MDHFAYRQGRLHCEDVALEAIAASVGTPVYVYATATLERHYRVFREAFAVFDPTICFAVKANGNLSVIRTLARLGAGADVVSAGELRLAMAAGIPADRIVFSGVGKTESELAAAVRAELLQINVESEPELESLARIAQGLGIRPRVAFRVNPDVDARTHAHISTGRAESKFGIPWSAIAPLYAQASRNPALDVTGLAMHIGSQLTQLAPFDEAFARLTQLVETLRADGLTVTTLDLGGGLGIPYGNEADEIPPPPDYAAVIGRVAGALGCRLILEPGRLLVGNAGVLLTRVIYVKEGATRTFVIVDAGMNDLMRPALYDAHHAIVPVLEAAEEAPRRPVDVVGPVCESTDTFARVRPLPPVAAGDLLALRSAGAYSAVMASTYNARPIVPEVLVNADRFAIVRERIDIDTLLRHQPVPSWLHDEPTPVVRVATSG